MLYVIGVVLFALGIALSIALHEAGHMLTAKAFGMKVRRYYIGFGPKIFSFRRGETEYGLKAIPAGGFCDIAGMTKLDPVTEEEAPRAFWRFATWKRVIVLSAGSITHFIVGFLILYLAAQTTGVFNDHPIVTGVSDCVAAKENQDCQAGAGPAPAKAAGVQSGDKILSVNGKETPTWTDVSLAVRATSGSTTMVVERDGAPVTLHIDVTQQQRTVVDPTTGKETTKTVGIAGVSHDPFTTVGPLAAIPTAFEFTGEMFHNTWEGLKQFPQRIPAVVKSIGGGERDPNTPISVVGASRIGGEAVERDAWWLFLLLMASLNFFVGVFNLLPLLPLDGGHIAVNLYERVRDWVRKLRGLPAGGPVDYSKLAAVTMVVVFIGGAITLLTVTADIVNPIKIGN